MKISTITINFNNKKGLEKTFSSVFNQTFKDFEYIVIDGGSTDGSKELIEQNSGKISHWVSEPDNGIYDAMNKGIKKASAEFIIFINSGDSFYSENVIEEFVRIDSKFDIVYGNTNLFDPKTNKSIIKNYPDKCSLLFLLKDTIQHQGTMIKRELLVANNYNTDFKIISDWIWFFDRFLEKCSFHYFNFTTATFVLDGISSNFPEMLKGERDFFLKNKYPDYYLIINELNHIHNNSYHLKKKLDKLNQNIFIRILRKIRLLKNG